MKEIMIELDKCLGCKSCEFACAVEHSVSKSIFEAIHESKIPIARLRVECLNGLNVPLQCRHCEEPACVMACMSGALVKDQKTGLVVQKEDKCVGCSMCIMVCPYSSLFTKKDSRIVVKCDRCPDRAEPACVKACPTKAISLETAAEFSAKASMKYLGGCENDK